MRPRVWIIVACSLLCATAAGAPATPAPAAPAPAKAAPAPAPAKAVAKKDEGWTDVDWVVAVVNQDVVLRSDFERRLTAYKGALDSVNDPAERSRRRIELNRQVLGSLIEERLAAQEATRIGLTVSELDVDRAIAEVKAQNKVDDAGLAKALETNGFTMPQYREELRRQILQAKVVNLILRPRVQIGDGDVRAAYKEAQKRDPKGVRPFDEVKDSLQQKLFEDAMSRQEQDWLQELREVAFIDVRTQP